MKRVILIGDSIRMGYEDTVRTELGGLTEIWSTPKMVQSNNMNATSMCVGVAVFPANKHAPSHVHEKEEVRKRRLGCQLMMEAMDEALRRGIHYGLLFCGPDLECFYASLGWIKTSEKVIMTDEHGRSVPIPAKNITMFKELAEENFPGGDISLQGRDW